MKKFYLFFFCLLSLFTVEAQLESAHWYFGQNAGLDFSSGSPEVVYDGALETGEGCASISDVNGNLLFYTDGTIVYNRNHDEINNEFINPLKGDSSSTQSAIIVPYPGNLDLYYIFTVDAYDAARPGYTENEGFHYYIIDMTLNGGLGGLIATPNNNLLPLTSEKVTAVAHKNNDDIWVITHFEDKFYAYLVDQNGLNTTPVVSQIGPYLDPDVYPVNSRGYIKTSPKGNKIGIAHLSNLPLSELGGAGSNSDFANTYDGYAALYDFDDQTGIVSNEVVLSTEGSPYGLEFSFDSKFAYFQYDYHDDNYNWTYGELAQYDLSATDIPASKFVIFDDFEANNDLFQARGALQLALDNKIYYSHTIYWGQSYSGNYLSVIHSPNEPGLACDFEYNAVSLNNSANLDHYSSFGLPPFITSFFNAVIVFEGGISAGGVCDGQSINFSIVANDAILSVVWDFGDGNTSNQFNPTHTYANTGTYTVTAIVTTAEERVSLSKPITINPLPTVNNSELEKCDYDGDGIVLFELYEANDLISTDSDITISYHETDVDAASGENDLPNVYTNTSNPQTIYVRVENQFGCISFPTLELKTSPNQIQSAQPLELCDEASDGTEVFDLTQNQSSILSLYVDPVTILSYHKDITEAEFGSNPLNLNYTNIGSPEKIYVRIQTDSCIEIVSFDLILNPLPMVDIVDATICPVNGNISINAGTEFTSYLWAGLQGADVNQPENEPTVTITQPGTYTLTVWDDKGCNYTDSFTITHSIEPIISEIIISESGNVEIIAIGESPFEYSLNGVLWQSSNQFSNLPSGDYIAYVRDGNGCLSDEEGFGILEIPNFISPNNDGYNDNWVIKGITHYDDVHIQIFDRYGKIFVDRMNHQSTEVWDGNYLGRAVNSGSYWYIIKVSDGRKYVGTLAVRNY